MPTAIRTHSLISGSLDSSDDGDKEVVVDTNDEESSMPGKTIMKKRLQAAQTDSTLTDEYDNLPKAVDDEEEDDHAGQHPALKTMCVILTSKNQRIVPNCRAYEFENDVFFGKVMLLVRTPDVDNHRDKAELGETARRVSAYMKGKKRRFEFQFQIRLKRVPTGPLFLG